MITGAALPCYKVLDYFRRIWISVVLRNYIRTSFRRVCDRVNVIGIIIAASRERIVSECKSNYKKLSLYGKWWLGGTIRLERWGSSWFHDMVYTGRKSAEQPRMMSLNSVVAREPPRQGNILSGVVITSRKKHSSVRKQQSRSNSGKSTNKFMSPLQRQPVGESNCVSSCLFSVYYVW